MSQALFTRGLSSGYGPLQILWDIDFMAQRAETLVLLGSNGAGKTTFLKTLVGLIRPMRGEITCLDQRIEAWSTDRRIRSGMAYMSELGVVPSLSIAENLTLGSYFQTTAARKAQLHEMYDRFPDLAARKRTLAGSLSGGQRKMLGIAKALMSKPSILLLDEPSAGLSPLYVNQMIDLLRSLKQEAVTMIIAEQNTKFLELADRVSVLESGRISFQGAVDDLTQNDTLRQAYFGIH
ncbi:ABC transporter ATP-binding protein [Ferroacidibacillus organovorans]|uniref:ABC transporter ATP-binding protein n=1 Tax=Ferroacidibacillus organovorans TaxID=1765683 RepID=A0A101XNV2_9BACL|nr:ABC transporter ATP-binding protein [Ferroacidibacillus organovorans]KUO94687.1 ABC transporter ATP-binding protein [Ferroacidibacillus organovorans]